MVKPTVNLDLTKYTKTTTNELIYQQYFAELKSSYPDHVNIYTDGSKDGVSVTAAAIVNNKTLTCRLPDDSSIFSAEAKAIHIALEAIRGSKAGPYIFFLIPCPVFRQLTTTVITLLLLKFYNFTIIWQPRNTR